MTAPRPIPPADVSLHRAAGVPPPSAAPAIREGEHYDLAIELFGVPLTLQVNGPLREGHLLNRIADPVTGRMDLDQACLALEAAVLAAIEHDPQIRAAAQTIRASRPGASDAWVMTMLMPCLRILPGRIELRAPPHRLPNGQSWEAHRWTPDPALHVGDTHPTRHGRLGQDDVLWTAYHSFAEHHKNVAIRPDATPEEIASEIWEGMRKAFRQRPRGHWHFGTDRPSIDHLLRRIFGPLEGAAAEDVEEAAFEFDADIDEQTLELEPD